MIAHVISALVLEIAYLASGIALCFIGKDLLEKGITGKFAADGEIASRKLRIATSSPGLVFLIAGLAIVVTAIIQKSEYREETTYPSGRPASLAVPVQQAESAAVPAPSPRTTLSPVALDSMVRLVNSRFLSKPERQRVADSLMEDAHTERADGNPRRAMDHLAGAIAVWPGALRKARSDPGLRPLTEDAQFTQFASLRLSIALAAEREQTLTPEAKLVIQQVRIFGLSKPGAADTTAIRRLVAAVPRQRGREPAEATRQRLKVLLQTDPRALGQLLESPEHRWLMQDQVIFAWLQRSGEGFFKDVP